MQLKLKTILVVLGTMLLISESVDAQIVWPVPQMFPNGWIPPPGFLPMPQAPPLAPKVRVPELDLNKLLIAQSILIGKKEFQFKGPIEYNYWHKAIETVAIQLELLDPRENRYVLSQPQDFAADIKLLQGRFHELRSAPFLAEATRWPERTLVNEMMAFNRAYRTDIVNRLAIDTIHENELRATLTEIDQLYRVWDAVRDARCDYYYITVRRQALKQLRELIGDWAYYSGNLPPYVPIWRIPVYEGP